jgi:hypothetical protein
MKAESAAVSIRSSEEYGVSRIGERWTARRSTTLYALDSRYP